MRTKIQTKPREFGTKKAPNKIIAKMRAKQYHAKNKRKKELLSKAICHGYLTGVALFTVGLFAYGFGNFELQKVNANANTENKIDYYTISCTVTETFDECFITKMPNGELYEFPMEMVENPPLNKDGKPDFSLVTFKVKEDAECGYCTNCCEVIEAIKEAEIVENTEELVMDSFL